MPGADLAQLLIRATKWQAGRAVREGAALLQGLAAGLRLQLASLGGGRYRPLQARIGDALRSRTEGRQMTEVAIAIATLNRMLELGRPESVRLP